MAKWPSYLPHPSTSFKLDAEPNAQRTKMTSGYVRQRPMSERTSYVCSITWEFTDAEYQLFKSFLKYELNNGLDWFDCPASFGGGITEQSIRIVGGKYKSSYIHYMSWRVTLTADVKNVDIPSKEYWDLVNNPNQPSEGWYSLLEALELCINGRNF